MMLTTQERVDRLEVVMDQFVAQVNTALLRLERSQARTDAQIAEINARMERASAETTARMERASAETTARMERASAETTARMERASEETTARMERASAEIDARLEHSLAEMKGQAEKDREEARKDREEARKERRELARQLGDISNKLGTIVEDIIAPSLRRMAQEELDCGALQSFYIRVERWHPTTRQRREFDVIAVGARALLFNQTKATVRPEYAAEFVEFLRRGEFFEYFPEYAGKPLLPVFSSLYLPADIVTYLTHQRIYAVGMGEETMQVLNLAQVKET